MAESIITNHFSNVFHNLTDKNRGFKKQIVKKIADIRKNPEIGEPKRGKLRGLRGLHISDHFVIVYLIYRNYVVFIELEHHNKAYAESVGLMDRILEDERLLSYLHTLDIPLDEFADFVNSLRRHQKS